MSLRNRDLRPSLPAALVGIALSIPRLPGRASTTRLCRPVCPLSLLDSAARSQRIAEGARSLLTTRTTMDDFTMMDHLRSMLKCPCFGSRKAAARPALTDDPDDRFNDAMSMHSDIGLPADQRRKRGGSGLSRWTLLWSLFAGARRIELPDEDDEELNQALLEHEADATPLPDPHEPPSLLELTAEEEELAAEEERQIRRARRRARRRAKELGLSTRGLGEDDLDEAGSSTTSGSGRRSKSSRRSKRTTPDEDVFSSQSGVTDETQTFAFDGPIVLEPPPDGYTYDAPREEAYAEALPQEAAPSSHEFLANLAQSKRSVPARAEEPVVAEDEDSEGDTTITWAGPAAEHSDSLDFLRSDH